MIVFKDICFCNNSDCKKRPSCARALENYNAEEKKGKLFSSSEFDCINKHNMFIRFGKI